MHLYMAIAASPRLKAQCRAFDPLLKGEHALSLVIVALTQGQWTRVASLGSPVNIVAQTPGQWRLRRVAFNGERVDEQLFSSYAEITSYLHAQPWYKANWAPIGSVPIPEENA